MNKLLYFPYISVPDNLWLWQTLLYWDEVASIVPIEYTQRPNLLGSHMQNLVREGLVKQIFPEEYVFGFQNFSENFMCFVDSDSLIQNLSSIGKKGQLGPNKLLKTEKIHMGKLSDIGNELVERGLAIDNGRWFEVESHTAQTFMTYLAFILGQKTEYMPSTDRYNGFKSMLLNNVDSSQINIKSRVRDELRAQILEKILPVPKANIRLSDLLRFKEDNHNELSKYRNFIETFLIEVESTPENLREEKLKLFVEEAQDSIDYIKDKMRLFGGVNFNFVTLCSLTSSIFPISSAIQNGNKIELIGAMPGLLGAIYSTIRSNDISELKREPLAYAAIPSRVLSYTRKHMD